MSESHDHKDAHAGHGDIDQHVRAAYSSSSARCWC